MTLLSKIKDGDGVLEFDPDMPEYPSYKFFTETRWESDENGGYIGTHSNIIMIII